MAVNRRNKDTHTTFKGLNNVNDERRLENGELRKALNVDLTNRGALIRRDGYSLAEAGSFHSLYGGSQNLVVSGNTLYSLDSSLTKTALRTDLTANRTMGYAEYAAEVYYSNGLQFGIVGPDGAREWGVPMPNAPVLAAASGSFAAGTYRVLCTYLSDTGEESGAGDYGSITLTAGQGITVTLGAAPAAADRVRVYLTEANSSDFYLAADEAAATASVTLSSHVSSGKQLNTWDEFRVSPGDLLEAYNGRILWNSGRFLFYTQPLAPGRYATTNFFPFPEDITMIAAVDDGVFVGADRTYFLGGADIQKAVLTVVSDAAPIKRAVDTLYPGDYPEIQTAHKVWASDRGVVIGAPGGQIALVTEDRFTFDAAEEGAAKLLKRDGIIQLLTLLKEPSDSTENFGFGDSVAVTVRRNGVIIS